MEGWSKATVAESAAIAVILDTLDQTLARSKRISELMKSTGESLARIARLQSSMSRLWDSRSERLVANKQVVQEDGFVHDHASGRRAHDVFDLNLAGEVSPERTKRVR
jgi:hypothetical protein